MTNNLKNYITGYLGIDSVTAGEFITRLSDLCNYSGTPMSSKLKQSLNYYLGAKMTSIISDYTSFSGSTLTQAELRKIANTFPTNYDGVNIRNEFINLFSTTCFQGLLDLYPGVTAAYSVRRLSSLYTGPGVKVRRSSDNAQLDIGFVGDDLDTTALLSFVGAGNGFVTKWYDQSGNANDGSQATTANQPQIVSSGSLVTSNSKVSIEFSISDFLSLNSSIATTGLDIVGMTVGQRSSGHLFYLGSSSTGPYLTGQYASGELYFQTNTKYSDYTDAETNQVLLTSTSVSNTLGMRKNGVSQVLSGVTPYPVSGGYDWIGKNPVLDSTGKIQEIVLYTSNQSASVAAIETNINSYFNIYP